MRNKNEVIDNTSDFLKIISELSPREINDLIKRNGVPPKRIIPIIIHPVNIKGGY